LRIQSNSTLGNRVILGSGDRRICQITRSPDL
jgi:hypothetical protein